MPSAMETLVKILKLEQEKGCLNTAVIGGLAAYGETWKNEAREQARHRNQHILVEEMTDLLADYEEIESKSERHRKISYMLDRIMGREAAPAKYVERFTEESDDEPPPPLQKKKGGKRFQDRKQHEQSYDEFQSAYAFDVNVGTGELDIKPLPKLSRPPRKSYKTQNVQLAAEQIRLLNRAVTEIKGIGTHMAEKLSRLGIETVNDMLYYLPRRYDDYTQISYISKLQPEMTTTVIGKVTHTEVRIGRNNRKDFAFVIDDGSASMLVIFFGQHWLNKQIRKDQQLVLSGKITAFRNKLQMVNPEWEPLDSDNLHTVGIVPVYGLTEGLRIKSFRTRMKQTLDEWLPRVPEHIPDAVLERCELGDIQWTLRNLHFPEGHDHLEFARKRLIFDQLLVLQLAILGNRREWQSVPGTPLEITDEFVEGFIDAVFPYSLTNAQMRAVMDIRGNVSQELPMNRLIQGDVGSGKTAVATVAMAMAFSNGKQAALMAPTSILAEQHYRSIGATLEKTPGEQKPVVALLTSALTTTERQSIYRGLADGSIDIVIGTHAIIQEGVEFKDLAIAVVDEQHRFGVEQRGALRQKGKHPHLLVMTATPIPRTMALTVYADLDLTIIDEKPPGRQPVKTKVVNPNTGRETAYRFIESQIDQGRQAFVVHPLVEASETIDARSATEAFEELSKIFHHYRVCLLHGRMKPTEKDEIMAAFANYEYDIMVTTSVAEVGVDIPNASVIMIEGANRFGLSQLHQFRGRVGRGDHPSFCLLVPDRETPESQERLEAMEATDDGFKLAELDWKLRGAGDLLGTRQSGRHQLRLMEEMSPEMVSLAQREARTIYEEDPDLAQDKHRLIAERVAMLDNDNADMS